MNDEDYCLLGCDAMLSGGNELMLQGNTLPPLSGLKISTRKADIISQKRATFTFTVIRILNLIFYAPWSAYKHYLKMTVKTSPKYNTLHFTLEIPCSNSRTRITFSCIKMQLLMM